MRALGQLLIPSAFSIFLVACGGGGPSQPARLPEAPAAPTVTVNTGIKQLNFSWEEVGGAFYYKLLENPDGHSGFSQVGERIPRGSTSVTLPIAVHQHDWANALYIVQACSPVGCSGSTEVSVMHAMANAIGYFKASNTDWADAFGFSIAMSSDGRTLAVGAPYEEGNSPGIDGDQNDNSAYNAGAVYVFRSDGMNWSQQAYVKSSEQGLTEEFGSRVALSADGNTLVVGAPKEGPYPLTHAGAAYVFRFEGTAWFQQARIRASNRGASDGFGSNVALSADGNSLVVGAYGEMSNATGIDGDQSDDSLNCCAGAVYVFRFDGVNWGQEAYIKSSNTDVFDSFSTIAISADGNLLAVGASGESSSATGINGDQNDNSASRAGAVYVFRFHGADWLQYDYIKASNTGPGDSFGSSVALSDDGAWMAVGAHHESSNATGIDSNQNDDSATWSGAVYVFHNDGAKWSQHAYIKASNTEAFDYFGRTLALDGSGAWLAVGADGEDSDSTCIGENQHDNSAMDSGAVYLFSRDSGGWEQRAYVKATNTETRDRFGNVAISGNGATLAVGAVGEDSDATGIGGDQYSDPVNTLPAKAGAVYVY